MTLIRWEPLTGLEDFIVHCRPLFGRGATARSCGVGVDSRPTAAWSPAADVSESDAEYLIKAELPEVGKEDVRVTVDGGVITISGERRGEVESRDEIRHRVECSYGSFSRSFRLPDDADLEAIRAESRNGILKVRVPKHAAARPRTVEVQVN